MKKIFYIALILSAVLITSGCSGASKQEQLQLAQEMDEIKKDNQRLADEVERLKEENEDLSEQLAVLKVQIEQLKKENGSAMGQEEVLMIYGGNIDSYEKEEVGYIELSDDLSLEDKLDMLADRLSSDVFEGLGIEVSEIAIIHGKQVAIVNLIENEEAADIGWSTRYFQGSAGGSITSVALSSTFLQKDYKGEWIDGVKFLYNDKEIEFEHVQGLSEANYR